jgi:YVTN family beta-propeller protein
MNKKLYRYVALSGFLSLVFLAHSYSAGGQTNYKFIREIPIGDGRWDLMSIDAPARRLYVTHETRIVVIDLETDSLATEIGDTPGVHGFALASELGRGFSSNGAEARASVVDLKTLQTTAKVETGKNPDAILYEPGHGEVYAFNGRDNSVTIFDAKKLQVVATIPLGGKPELAVADKNAGRVYCNIEDTSEVVAIDTAAHKVVARWSLSPLQRPTGLALDRKNHRLFAGCDKFMAMIDSETGKTLATVPIGAGVDACEFEDATGLAFASCGNGSVTVAKEEAPDKLSVVQVLNTKPWARTMALDPKTHRIYLTTADFKEEPPPRPEMSATRRVPIPGTCRVLVYGPD